MPVCVLTYGAFPEISMQPLSLTLIRKSIRIFRWRWYSNLQKGYKKASNVSQQQKNKTIRRKTQQSTYIKFQATPIFTKSPHRFLDGFAPWFHDSLVENMSPGLYTALKIRSITSDNEYRVVALPKHVGILGHPNNSQCDSYNKPYYPLEKFLED